MPKLKFTVAALTKHSESAQGYKVAWDTEVRGLGAYRNGNGSCTLFAQYRLASGVQRKKTIGRLSELTLSDARAIATEYALAGRHGRDLVQERKAGQRKGTTLSEAYHAYDTALVRRGASSNTRKLNGHNWNRFLSSYGTRVLTQISKRDVRTWHGLWRQSGPTAANHAARLLRAIFNYAAKFADEPLPNPCTAIEYFAERCTRRSISWHQLPNWHSAVEQIPNPVRRTYWKFLLFSGLRKQDAATIRWDEVFETHIHRPNPKGGRTKAFNLPITKQLAALLIEARTARDALYPNSPFVFPAASRRGHISDPGAAKFIPGCSPHDLRRTYATACVEAGVDPYVIKTLLNHAPDKGDVTSLYVQISPEHKATSAQRVADFLSKRSFPAQ